LVIDYRRQVQVSHSSVLYICACMCTGA